MRIKMAQVTLITLQQILEDPDHISEMAGTPPRVVALTTAFIIA